MIRHIQVRFHPGKEDRMVSVWLPEGYEESEERYPVMYMFDGQLAFADASCAGCWEMDAFLSRFEKPMMIVALHASEESDRRMAEYCPYHLPPRLWEGLRGRGKETMEWICFYLKPMIDSRYRTYPDRRCSALMGASMGGVMSLYGVTAFNDVFSKAACISPALSTGYAQIISQLRGEYLDPDTRIFLSFGEKEARDMRMLAHMVHQNLSVANLLMKHGARVHPYMQDEGRHCEQDWKRQADTFMRFLWME